MYRMFMFDYLMTSTESTMREIGERPNRLLGEFLSILYNCDRINLSKYADVYLFYAAYTFVPP